MRFFRSRALLVGVSLVSAIAIFVSMAVMFI